MKSKTAQAIAATKVTVDAVYQVCEKDPTHVINQYLESKKETW